MSCPSARLLCLQRPLFLGGIPWQWLPLSAPAFPLRRSSDLLLVSSSTSAIHPLTTSLIVITSHPKCHDLMLLVNWSLTFRDRWRIRTLMVAS
ncbi:hypothetical protein BU24DRAFT_170614 [Aaosphaeria arxii CBS 175.79]|uniref:Uncharacterized protein n=1 Tax=Aaosphaeria arxii CBS 175.79 TaxID=1450172 RepID=A0A6A5Y1H5_9PLEO|nr:uncharacterized protein BU24DRAFT_170614 [Aaosphaeria arxii CBS 175.79]KAF2018414.1 hypothetical protein BU24DRAFT_170614 [Aaosphaeria arxii CBS 175.79]